MASSPNAVRPGPYFSANGSGVGAGDCEIVRSYSKPSNCLSLLGLNTSSAVEYARSAVFDGTHFIIGAYRFGASYITYSSDGVIWNSGLSGVATSEGYTISSDGAGLLLACTGTATAGNIVRSTDHGVTWQASGTVPELISYYTLGYGNGIWIAIEAGNGVKTARSLDGGLTWSIGGTLPNSTSNGWSSLIRMQTGVWVLSGAYNSATLVSYDEGVSWKTGGNSPAGSSGRMAYNSVTNMLVKGAPGGVYPLSLSFDGVNWINIGKNNDTRDSIGALGKYILYHSLATMRIFAIDSALNFFVLANVPVLTGGPSVLFVNNNNKKIIILAGTPGGVIFSFTEFKYEPGLSITE